MLLAVLLQIRLPLRQEGCKIIFMYERRSHQIPLPWMQLLTVILNLTGNLERALVFLGISFPLLNLSSLSLTMRYIGNLT